MKTSNQLVWALCPSDNHVVDWQIVRAADAATDQTRDSKERTIERTRGSSVKALAGGGERSRCCCGTTVACSPRHRDRDLASATRVAKGRGPREAAALVISLNEQSL
jgi:hypothetical protein